MQRLEKLETLMNRRAMLARSAAGIGSVALTSILAQAGAEEPAIKRERIGGLSDLPHFAPKVKRVIYLLMPGAPSQVDTLDYKPNLEELRGTDLPDSVQMGQRLTTMTAGQAKRLVLPSRAPYKQFGQCGTWISELLPHTGSIADELCL